MSRSNCSFRRRLAAVACAACSVAAFSHPARADRSYIGPVNGNWNDASNWDPFGIPGDSDNVFINFSDATNRTINYDYTGPAVSLSALTLDNTGSGVTALSQTTNTVLSVANDYSVGLNGFASVQQSNGVVNANGNDSLRIGVLAGAAGTYSISSTAVLNANGNGFTGAIRVGENGQGTLLVSGGQINSKGVISVGVSSGATGFVNQTAGNVTTGTPTTTGGSLFVGRNAGSSGAYNISNTASLNIYGNLQEGYNGNGTFNQNGGTVNIAIPTGAVAAYLFVGNGPTAAGSYVMNDGTLSSASGIFVGGDAGGAGGNGTLTINGGVVNSGPALTIWDHGTIALGGGTVTVGATPSDNLYNAGTINDTGGTLIIGGRIYGPGVFNNSGGTVIFANNSADDTQDIRNTGGASVANGLFVVGKNTGTPGILNVSAGTFSVSGAMGVGNTGTITSGAGVGTVNVSGGQLRAQQILLGSTSGGAAAMNISNTGVVNVGSASGAGELVNATTLSISSASAKLNWIAGDLAVTDSSTIDNHGVFSLADNAMLFTPAAPGARGLSAGVVLNHGTILKPSVIGSVGTTFIGSNGAKRAPAGGVMTVQSDNGTFEVDAGTLDINANFQTTLASTTTVSGGGTFVLSGAQDWAAGSVLDVEAGATLLNADIGASHAPAIQVAGGQAFVNSSQHLSSVNVDNGAAIVTAGISDAGSGMTIGRAGASVGSFAMSGGSLTVHGVMGVGNTGTLTAGTGTGHAAISAGSLYADTIVLGSTTGGSGDMTLSNTASVSVGGGFSINDLTVNGGALTILDQNPATPEDAVLNRALVGGYMRDGAMNVNGGVVTSPNIKLGVSPTKVGGYTQTAGTVNVGTLLIGSAAGGIGSATMSGGTLIASSQTRLEAQGTFRYDDGYASLGAVTLNGGGKIILSAGNVKLLHAGSVSIDTANASSIDLSDNDMRLTGDTYTNVAGNIAFARHAGARDRGGITSSAAALAFPRNKTLGTLTGAQYHQAQGNAALFEGEVVSNTDLLIKYTYYGDANFNGKVDGGDYARIKDSSFNAEHSAGNIGGWFNGDFDYNGKVDGGDYALIDTAFNSQNGTLNRALSYLDGSDTDPRTMNNPALGMVMQHYDQFGSGYASDFARDVPEPASAIAAASMAAGMLLRRRRLLRQVRMRPVS